MRTPLIQTSLLLTASFAAGCGSTEDLSGDVGRARQRVSVNHVVTVDAYGRFNPLWTDAHDGDTVTFQLYDRNDAIVRANWSGSWPAACDTPAPYDSTDPNELAGPMPVGAAGIFVMGPKDDNADPETWASPRNRGVFVRMRWDLIDGGPNWASNPNWSAGQRYDWTVLDEEMNAAVANAKMFSVAVKAGIFGTPDWIFQTDENGADRGALGGGVTRVALSNDRNDDEDTGTCGSMVYLGNPGEQAYRDHYNEMLTALGDHIRSRAAWYQRLAYVKLGGANFDTHELKLPRNCVNANCCNPELWALAGYTPSGLYGFFEEQAATMLEAFPNKSISYQVIHDGFPIVGDPDAGMPPGSPGDYPGFSGEVDADGNGTIALPDAIEQMWTSVRRLQDLEDELGNAIMRERLVVQQNGLRTGPAYDYKPPYDYGVDGQCRYDGVHPVGGPAYDVAGSGCPNQWVLRSGYRTRNLNVAPYDSLTGFQTIDASNGVATLPELELALQNAMDSSDAVFVEIYQSRFLEAEQNGKVLDPTASNLDLGGWSDAFEDRRRLDWVTAELPDPRPLEYTITVTRTLDLPYGNELLHYIHASKCGIDYADFGTEYQYGGISIQP